MMVRCNIRLSHRTYPSGGTLPAVYAEAGIPVRGGLVLQTTLGAPVTEAVVAFHQPADRAAPRAWHFALALGLAWLLLCAQLLGMYWQQSAWTMPDADDAMRLVQMREFLAGHGWFDLHWPRLGPPVGYDLHWSRLIDAGLAGLYLSYRAFTGPEFAERLMAVTWPSCGWFSPWPVRPRSPGGSVGGTQLWSRWCWSRSVVQGCSSSGPAASTITTFKSHWPFWRSLPPCGRIARVGHAGQRAAWRGLLWRSASKACRSPSLAGSRSGCAMCSIREPPICSATTAWRCPAAHSWRSWQACRRRAGQCLSAT